jgi:serine/threonine protein phosphatase 1
MRETAFIGDVHGEVHALEDLLRIVLPKSRRLVLLGDLVNRGPASKGVLDLLVQLRDCGAIDVVLLAGNHDEAFADVLKDSARENEFLRMGGAATIQSYVMPPYRDVFAQLRDAVPASHVSLLESQRIQWESDQVVARHRWTGNSGSSGRYVIAGHSVQVGRVPHIDDGKALIDTGCGTIRGGRLTAFYWPSRSWDQVDVPLA